MFTNYRPLITTVFVMFNFSTLQLEPDFLEGDGDDDDNRIVEMNGVQYPQKSWFFIFHSTIKGNVSMLC